VSGVALTIADVVRGTQGALVRGRLDGVLSGVSIDSRTCEAGQAFFAIRGHRQDGHAFGADAVRAGAAALVVSREPPGVPPAANVAVVLVDETTLALQRLAAFHRRRHTLPIVAVTGSNGKTTTKELTALVLSQRLRVLKAAGSQNNQWGVPLTLLGIEPGHEAAVLELGMNAPGEIEALAHLAQPTVGVVTTIAPAHLEFLGSLEGVQKAKGELVQAVPPEGTVILNADDPLALALTREARGRVVTYGRAAAADVRLFDLVTSATGLAFSVATAGETATTRLPLPGVHNALNATAAVAIGVVLGIPLTDAAAALAGALPVKGRLVWHQTGGVRILDDTYNANPPSLRAALDVLREAGATPDAADGRAFVILGDMRELGGLAEPAHRDAGAWIAALPAAGLVTAGPLARLAAEAARGHGCRDVVSCDTATEAAAELLGRLAPGDRVLVKGSRSLAMERAVTVLLERLGRGHAAC
jgi:UDP-N-acetylmuramoyl-tripeptide--D-alanyl-D-alanine ligase